MPKKPKCSRCHDTGRLDTGLPCLACGCGGRRASIPKAEISGALSCEWEPLATLLDDGMADLVRQHHAEVGVYKKQMPLDVNWEEYQAKEDQGMLHTLGGRINGKLVGYNAFFVTPHIHYWSTLHALGDAIYVLPKHRRSGIGILLIDKAERDLVERAKPGWLRIWYHDKVDLKLLGPVLVKRGYKHNEDCYDKVVRSKE
jgi:GNAT superfamily N-acetyltransferase